MSGSIITPQVLTDQERQLQKEEAMKKRATPATSTAESVYSGPGEITKLLADVEAFGKFVDELSVTILGVSRLDTVWKVGIFLQFVCVFVVFVCGKPACLTAFEGNKWSDGIISMFFLFN